MKIFVTGDNGPCLPTPYGGIMKRCLLHAKHWRLLGAEVCLHVHNHHDDESDLGAGAQYVFDFNQKPTIQDKIFFLLKNFVANPMLFIEALTLATKLNPTFDAAYLFYIAGRACKIQEVISDFKPDIIVTETGGLQSLVAVLVANKNNIPVVIENYAEIQYKAKADGVNIAPLFAPMWKYIFDGVDLVIPASKHCALGPQKYISDESKMQVVYSGISFNVFNGRAESDKIRAREKFNLPADKRLVMAVGSLQMRKGHDHLFEALTLLPPEDRKEIVVVLCGMGNIPELKARAAEVGFPDEYLKIYSGLSEDDLAELYSAVDCFCFPSISPRECMGMAMKEAMAIGLPIAAYDVGGIKEAIEVGVNGVLVSAGDKHALALAVKKLLILSKQDREQIRVANIEKARQLFDIKDTSKQMLDLLKQVVDNKKTA